MLGDKGCCRVFHFHSRRDELLQAQLEPFLQQLRMAHHQKRQQQQLPKLYVKGSAQGLACGGGIDHDSDHDCDLRVACTYAVCIKRQKLSACIETRHTCALMHVSRAEQVSSFICTCKDFDMYQHHLACIKS